MIKAAIFDLDGLLVDSEPCWHEASLRTFTALGVPMTAELEQHAIGLRSDEEVHYWHKIHPWTHPSQDQVHHDYIELVSSLMRERAGVMLGAKAVLKLTADAGLALAVASSSPMTVIQAELAKIGVRAAFKAVHSAEHERYGKPHPEVYISTAHELGVEPEECLAFEDSFNGLLSAKSAKMKCVAIPDPRFTNDPRFSIADLVLGSLTEFKRGQLAKFL